MQENIEVVKRFYEHLANNRLTEAMHLLDEAFILIQAESLPYGGKFVGREGIENFFKQFFGFWEAFRSENTAYYAAENKVFATSVGIGKSRQGLEIQMPMIQIYTLSNQKLLRAEPFYLDTALFGEK